MLWWLWTHDRMATMSWSLSVHGPGGRVTKSAKPDVLVSRLRNLSARTLGVPHQDLKLYVEGQVSEHWRPGMTIYGAGRRDGDIVCRRPGRA